MAKLCFIKPYMSWQFDPYSDPPLGMLSVAASARTCKINGKNVDVALFDISGKEDIPADYLDEEGKLKDEKLEVLLKQKLRNIPAAEFYGLSASTLEFPAVTKIAHEIKKLNPNSKIIVGGPHVDVFSDEYWQEEIHKTPFDIVSRGEGEANIESILNCREDGKKVFSQNGCLIDINSLEMPARDLLDKEKYFRPGKTFGVQKYLNRNSSTIMVTRGCPYKCGFCASPALHKRKLRARTLDNVAKELDELKTKYDVGQLRWQDDNIPLNIKMIKGFESLLKNSGIYSRGSARVNDIVKPGMLDMLWDAGFREIGFGIEAAEDGILNIINKETSVKLNKEALIKTKERGFLTRAFIMTGLPGETKDSAYKMIEFLEETNPDVVTFTSFIPLPGCDIFNKPADYGLKIIDKDWRNYDIALKRKSGVQFVHRVSGLSVEDMENNREILKEYLFNKGKSNVSVYNKEYKAQIKEKTQKE